MDVFTDCSPKVFFKISPRFTHLNVCSTASRVCTDAKVWTETRAAFSRVKRASRAKCIWTTVEHCYGRGGRSCRFSPTRNNFFRFFSGAPRSTTRCWGRAGKCLRKRWWGRFGARWHVWS